MTHPRMLNGGFCENQTANVLIVNDRLWVESVPA